MSDLKPLAFTSSNIVTEIPHGDFADSALKLKGGNTVVSVPSTGSPVNSGRAIKGLSTFATDSTTFTGAIVLKAPAPFSADTYCSFTFSGVAGGWPLLSMLEARFNSSGPTGTRRVLHFGGSNQAIAAPVVSVGVAPDGCPCIILGGVSSVWPTATITVDATFTNVVDANTLNWDMYLEDDLSAYTSVAAATVTNSNLSVSYATFLTSGFGIKIGNKLNAGLGTANTNIDFTPLDIGTRVGTTSFGSSSGSAVIDLATGASRYEITLTENTTISFTNVAPGNTGRNEDHIIVTVRQGASTAYTCSFSGASVLTAGGTAWSPSSVLSSVEDVGVRVDSTNNIVLYPSGVQV